MCYCAFLGYPHLGNITRGPLGISGTEEGTHRVLPHKALYSDHLLHWGVPLQPFPRHALLPLSMHQAASHPRKNKIWDASWQVPAMARRSAHTSDSAQPSPPAGTTSRDVGRPILSTAAHLLVLVFLPKSNSYPFWSTSASLTVLRPSPASCHWLKNKIK